MATAKPVRLDVPGAPFQIGQRVKVVAAIDETTDQSFIGRSGTIEYYEYSCGCGQAYPNDPRLVFGSEMKSRNLGQRN
jgi:hypothetical protein